jgi:hypothetical protein
MIIPLGRLCAALKIPKVFGWAVQQLSVLRAMGSFGCIAMTQISP